MADGSQFLLRHFGRCWGRHDDRDEQVRARSNPGLLCGDGPAHTLLRCEGVEGDVSDEGDEGEEGDEGNERDEGGVGGLLCKRGDGGDESDVSTRGRCTAAKPVQQYTFHLPPLLVYVFVGVGTAAQPVQEFSTFAIGAVNLAEVTHSGLGRCSCPAVTVRAWSDECSLFLL